MKEETNPTVDTNQFKLDRCMDWLQKQNHPKKLAQQNKNDIQFIIETNAHRKQFLLSTAEDDATVPAGVDERALLPKAVPHNRLRFDGLSMECEWQSCRECHGDYKEFQEHVTNHASEAMVVNKGENVSYTCLWDVCGHETPDFEEMVRHINYHSYHARLLAIGFNARATLNLESCRRDSSKRNQLPPLKTDHTCRWFECTKSFNSFQKFIEHIVAHVKYLEKGSEYLCSWAGCGMKFNKRLYLNMHLRSHTGEKLIACYHCGTHFTSNHKLSTHLSRQNSAQECGYQCSVCGKWYATAYLVREHSRQHVSYYACSLCDMSAPTRAAIAVHMRYKHLDSEASRMFPCPQCSYKAVTKFDLEKHIKTHKKRTKKKRGAASSDESSNEDVNPAKKIKKETKKYACHLCPSKKEKMFSRGHRLTTHLVNVHGAQWPFGHSRFRYQISEDGIYRLTTTRIEDLEVSKKIVGGNSIPKESLETKFEFDLKRVKNATEHTPVQYKISVKGEDDSDNVKEEVKMETMKSQREENVDMESGIKIESVKSQREENVEETFEYDTQLYNVKELVEICTYDVDESGNITCKERTIQAKNDILNVSIMRKE